MKNNANEIGIFVKNVLKDKLLIKLKNNINYTNYNIIGKTIYNIEGQRIGKILDVIGNTKQPYALAILEQNYKIKPNEKIFINIKQRRMRK